MSSRPDGNGRLVPTLVSRVLDYMSSPWRAAVILVLVVLGGLGWGAWSERDYLKGLIAPKPPELRLDLSAQLSELLADTSADMAMVWRLDLTTNSARFIAGQTRNGKPWLFTPRTLPFFTQRTTDRLSRILTGAGDCEPAADVESNPGPLMRRLLADQYIFLCFEPVPPADDRLLAVIGMGWVKPPDKAEAQGALIAAGRLAWEMLR